MPAKTSAASAICGTHFGDTNAETSITRVAGGRQAIDERDLVGGGDERPLRSAGRRAGRPRRSVTRRRQRSHHSSSSRLTPGCTSSPFGAVHGLDDAVARRADRQLHLHRFEHDQRVAVRRRAWPGATLIATTVAGIGAITPPSPRAFARARRRRLRGALDGARPGRRRTPSARRRSPATATRQRRVAVVDEIPAVADRLRR